MSKRADRRREIERLFCLRDREGLSLQALSDRSGIPVGTLSWWSHRLRTERTPAFTELRVRANEPAEAHTADDNLVRLRLPGGAIAEFEGDLAERVSGALIESVVRWC